MQQKAVVRGLSGVLVIGGLGHTAGTLLNYAGKPEVMLWSLCTSLFVFLLGAVNWLRATRTHDRPLAWIALIFNLAWLAACVQFGRIIGKPLDPRVLLFMIVTLALIGTISHSLLQQQR